MKGRKLDPDRRKPLPVPVRAPGEPLSDARWEQFAQHVAGGMEVSKAAQVVGFRVNLGAGPKIPRTLDVRERIRELQDEAAKILVGKVSVTQEWILNRLKLIVDRAIDRGERLDSPIRALELLGKHLGMFVDRSEITGDITITSLIDRLKQRRQRLNADVTADVTVEKQT